MCNVSGAYTEVVYVFWGAPIATFIGSHNRKRYDPYANDSFLLQQGVKILCDMSGLMTTQTNSTVNSNLVFGSATSGPVSEKWASKALDVHRMLFVLRGGHTYRRLFLILGRCLLTVSASHA